MSQQETLLREIAEITKQYKEEVPGGRKTWPRSIRERVVQLYRLGLSAKAVADKTGIAYYTVLNWKKRDPEFKRIKILPLIQSATVTVPESKKVATVTVTTPKGLLIEGLTFDQLLIALERLR